MSIPAADLDVPATVRALAGGAALTPVWRNELGGVTFRADDGRHIKYGPRNTETSMADEAERLRWAGRFTPVPQVLDAGADATHEWLVTATLDGRSAVDPRSIAEPAVAVRAVGEGLRALHDALPAAECPYDWGVTGRIRNAGARGIHVDARLHVREEIPFFTGPRVSVEALVAGLRQAAADEGVPFSGDSEGGMFGFFFTDEPEITRYEQVTRCDMERFKRFYHLMLEEGVYLAPSAYEAGFLSLAHGDKEIEHTLAAAERSFAKLAG